MVSTYNIILFHLILVLYIFGYSHETPSESILTYSNTCSLLLNNLYIISYPTFKTGYKTSTSIKLMASIQDVDDGNLQWHFARESGLKALFASLHELYVEHTLNPFSNIRQYERISSPRFDDGIEKLVGEFNDTYRPPENMSWM